MGWGDFCQHVNIQWKDTDIFWAALKTHHSIKFSFLREAIVIAPNEITTNSILSQGLSDPMGSAAFLSRR